MALTQVNAGLIDSTSQPNSFKNRIINGAMMIDQRNAGASQSTTNTYTVDRFAYYASQTSKFTWGQNLGSVTPPTGFKNYLGFSVSSAVSLGASDYFVVQQPIEGNNTADLGWGTASAKSVTLSFIVRSSLTGTFGGALLNGAVNRSYPFSYTISAANTWTTIAVTVPGDTTGTWATDNSTGLYVEFSLGSGSTYAGTANTWAGAYYQAPTGATSVVGTNGATFYITGVQLEKGSTATSFDYRPYGTELALCQRYYEVAGAGVAGRTNPSGGTSALGIALPFKVTKRATPTTALIAGISEQIAVAQTNTYTLSSIAGQYGTVNGVYMNGTPSSSTPAAESICSYNDNWLSVSAEL